MLLIPMAVEALMVNRFGNSGKFADVNVNYELLNSISLLGGEIEPGPFGERAPLPAGVHLHFILPDGFTQGMETKDGFDYPAVPDRYLVTRIAVDKTKPNTPVISHRAWIVESSHVSTTHTESITIPSFGEGKALYRYLGRAYPYEEERQEGESLEKLTAIGAGSPYFAACYQECRSVFGFHDPCVDVEAGDFIYSVAGWYTKPEQSPLYGLSGDKYQQKLKDMGFSLTETETAEEDYHILLHGAVCHVKWEGEMGEYEFGYPEGNVQVALGNTSVEAVSALAAHKLAKDKKSAEDIERMLNVLQYNLLGEMSGADGILRTEDRMHRHVFQELDCGTEWYLSPADGCQKIPSVESRQVLQILNGLQKQTGVMGFQIAAKKAELYDVWYTYMLLYSYPSPPFVKKPLTEKEIEAEADRMIQELEVLQRQLAEIQGSIDRQLEKLKLVMEDLPFVAEKKSSIDRYFLPEVPVILMAGDGVNPSLLFGEDGRFSEEKLLDIRTDRGCISSVCFMKGSTEFSWNWGTLQKYCDDFPKWSGVPDAARSLYQEILLLYLAEGYEKKSYTGVLPSPVAVTRFLPPWNPLFLEWRIHLLLSGVTPQKDETMKCWQLADLDYEYLPEAVPTARREYTGRMLITPHAAKGLGDSILRHLEAFREDEEMYRRLKEIGERALKLPILSQNMSGLNENFLCRKQAFQFPLFGETQKGKAFADKLRKYIPAYGELSLDTDQEFLPIRAGFMKLVNLRVVDTFGQAVDLDADLTRITIPESMEGRYLESGYAALPPRLTAGARMLLEWGEGEACQDFISGYLIADFLNQRINLFHSGGEYAGNLHLVYQADGSTCARLEEEKGEKLTGHMRLLALEMVKQEKGVFADFLRLLDERLSEQISVDETDSQELPVLTGRPIAVLRAQLSLEQQGLLPYSKAFENFGKRVTKEFEKNEFTAHIGDVRYGSDGLIGCYAGAMEAAAYQTFYPAYGGGTGKHSYFEYNCDWKLKVNAAPILLTLLLDVRGSVHIRTGILPVYEAKPDYRLFSEALKNMKLLLPFFPVLAGGAPLNLIQPGTGNTKFQWYYKDGAELVEKEIKDHLVEGELSREKNRLMDGYMGEP